MNPQEADGFVFEHATSAAAKYTNQVLRGVSEYWSSLPPSGEYLTVDNNCMRGTQQTQLD